jgi:hypothetical protein
MRKFKVYTSCVATVYSSKVHFLTLNYLSAKVKLKSSVIEPGPARNPVDPEAGPVRIY